MQNVYNPLENGLVGIINETAPIRIIHVSGVIKYVPGNLSRINIPEQPVPDPEKHTSYYSVYGIFPIHNILKSYYSYFIFIRSDTLSPKVWPK